MLELKSSRVLRAVTLAGSLFAAACSGSSGGDEPSGSAGAPAGGGSSALAGTAGQLATQGGMGGGGQGGAGALGGGAGGFVNSGGSLAGAGAGAAGSGAGGGTSGNGGAGGNGGNGGASANGGFAGTGGSGGSEPNNDYLKTHSSGYGYVQLAAASDNQILSLTTTLSVPAKPSTKTGTLFLWPGLQPGGANYQPIDNGVLQPVLTWGPTCAPNAPNTPYGSWWVSAQYVNTYGMYPGYTDCHGGDGMNVNVGDELLMVMKLSGTIWHQAVTDGATQKTVSYDLDMLGQAQNYAEFDIEIYSEDPASDVIFTNTEIVLEKSQPKFCQPTTRGINDFFTNPRMSADGKTCAIDRIVLRAKGVPATSPN